MIKLRLSHEADRILKNLGWLIGDKVFTMVIGVFVMAIVARYLGPENFGQYHYAGSFVALFTAFSTLGLDTLTVKAIVNKEYDEGTILCTSLVLRVFGGIVLTLLAAIIIRILESGDGNMHILVLIMSLTMVIRSLEVIEYWIQAYQRADISSIIRMGTYVIIAGLKVALVVYGGNIILLALIYMVDALIIGIALITAYFRNRKSRSEWRINFSYGIKMLSQSWYIIISGIMITLYMQVDKVMLGALMPTRSEVGIYSAATQIAQMWYFVPLAVITSFKPALMNRKRNSPGTYMSSVQLLYNIVAWLGIIFGSVILVLSNIIVGTLYGPDYSKAASILTVNVWAGTFAVLGSARSVWLITEGLQRYSIAYTFAGLIVNIVLNCVLIPVLGGYGAAVATLASQFAASILASACFRETRVSSLMLIKAFSPAGLIKNLGYFRSA